MSVYVFVGMALLLVEMMSQNKSFSKGLFQFSFVLLLLISVLRFDVGTDYSAYQIIFEHPELMSTKELGFMLVNKAVKFLGFHFQVVVMIYACVTLLCAMLVIAENSCDIGFSLLVFYAYTPFYLDTFNAMRQACAVFVFLYAIRYIRRKKFMYYCILILGAAFFAHASVVIAIPFYVFLNRKYTFSAKIIYIIACLGFAFLVEKIVEMTPYAIYLKMLANNSVSPVLMLDILLTIAVVFATSVSGKNMLFYNLSLVSLGVFVMMVTLIDSPVFTVLFRVNEYFLYALILTIPEAVKSIKKGSWLCRLFVSFCMFGVFVQSLRLNGVRNEIVPYKTFFGKFGGNAGIDIGLVVLAVFLSLVILVFALRKGKGVSQWIN